MTDLVSIQLLSSSPRPDTVGILDGSCRIAVGAVRWPVGDAKLQLRLCSIAHSGSGGHRGSRSTLQTI